MRTDFTGSIDSFAVMLGKACDRQPAADALVAAAEAGGEAAATQLVTSWLRQGMAAADSIEDPIARKFIHDLLAVHISFGVVDDVGELACHYASETASETAVGV